MSVNLINQAIEEYQLHDQIDGIPGKECAGSRFHSPTPLTSCRADLADIFSMPVHNGDDPIWLCPNCLANLRIYVRLMVASEGHLPWETRRQFGNLIRDLGAKTWESYHQQHDQEQASD